MEFPLEKLFNDYQDAITIESRTPLHVKVQKVDKEADLRAIWFDVLQKLPEKELDYIVFNQKLSNGETIKNTALKYNLYPQNRKISPKIRTTPVELNIGHLSQLPSEIRLLIFRCLTFNDVSALASVSKSWFSITTSSDVWAPCVKDNIGDLDPFTSIQHQIINKNIWKNKDHYVYATDVEVTNGEGLLVCEEGYLQGIKLNGHPIMSAWYNESGSLARCMVRSKVLSKEEIDSTVKKIESFLNEGTIDFLTLGDTLKPFMNCMANGSYRIRVQSNLFCWLLEYKTNDDLGQLIGDVSSDEENIYCTQPSDRLSLERVKFYEEKIKQRKRLIVLAIKGAYDYFLIDGHHKIKAYYNLEKERDMIMVSIEASDPIKLTRQEELAYIQHSVNGINSFIESEKAAEKRRLKRQKKQLMAGDNMK